MRVYRISPLARQSNPSRWPRALFRAGLLRPRAYNPGDSTSPAEGIDHPMGVLRNFESRLERGIEGFFKAAFRSGLQPIELAKRILRQMEANKTVGVREVWVPNRYVLVVSDEDRERFSGAEGALVRELETVVTEGARENGWGLVARPEVVFETDEGLKRGDLVVRAELTEATGPATAGSVPVQDAAGARLVLADNGREWSLDRDRSVIGRLTGSEIEDGDRITIGRTVLEFRRR